MKKNTLLVIIAVVGICLLVIAYVLHLMDYIPGLKTVMDRGLLGDRYILWIGNSEIIMMALASLFGLLCLKLSVLRHFRNIFLILLVLFMFASSAVLLFFTKEKVPYGENAIVSANVHYLMLRMAAISALASIVLYVLAMFIKDRILSIIAMVAGVVGLAYSLLANTLTRLYITKDFANQS